MMRQVWALRVVGLIVAVGGALFANSVQDADRPAVGSVILLAAIALGALLMYLSTKIKA
jgi:hypothetical protein